MTLIDQFIREEANIVVRRLIHAALERGQSDTNVRRDALDFNRFRVEIDFVHAIVLLVDVLSENATESMGIEQFENALRNTRAAVMHGSCEGQDPH